MVYLEKCSKYREKISAARLAGILGGGGHADAAGAILKQKLGIIEIQAIVSKLREEIKKTN